MSESFSNTVDHPIAQFYKEKFDHLLQNVTQIRENFKGYEAKVVEESVKRHQVYT